MRTRAHSRVIPALVRGREITRDAVTELPERRGYLVVTGLGAPRGWGQVHEPVHDGFVRGLEVHADAPIKPRLRNAFNTAREELVRRCDALIERRAPDAGLLALYLDEDDAHVISVGPNRAYHWRGSEHSRLSSREADPTRGLLRGDPTHAITSIGARDTLMLGSEAAFTEVAVRKVANVMRADSETEVAILAALLTDPARELGTGAAAMVLRIE